MKNQRIAQAAMVMLLAASCSGGEEPEQAAPSDAVVETATPTIAPGSSGGEVFDTIAPTTSAAPVTTTAPNSLAFSSASDVGRLFEAQSSTILYSAAQGEITGAIESGTLVQATSARSRDGVLWVRVSQAAGEQATLGWVESDQLSPTSQSVITSDASLAGELRSARRGTTPTSVYATPEARSQVTTLAPNEIAMSGGFQAIGPSGDTFVDLVDSNSRTRIGWVPIDQFASVQSNSVRNGAHEPARNRPDSAVSYGAPLPQGSITLVGCNAAQIFFSNSSTQGLAMVIGEDVPTGRTQGSTEIWSAAGGGRFYVEPGESVTFTMTTGEAKSWYFAGLNGEFQAEAPRSANGSLLAEPATATSAQQIDLNAGSCVIESLSSIANSSEFSIDSGEQEILDALPASERAAALERFYRTGSLTGEPVAEERVEEELVEDELVEELTETEGAAESTPTTTAAPTTTTTTAAPTTTTTTAAPTTTTTTAAPTTTTSTEAPAEGA